MSRVLLLYTKVKITHLFSLPFCNLTHSFPCEQKKKCQFKDLPVLLKTTEMDVSLGQRCTASLVQLMTVQLTMPRSCQLHN